MEFICTNISQLYQPGERSEEKIWNKVKSAFAGREGIAYWQYPLFVDIAEEGNGTQRKYKEPDILIVDRELGLILIEVKGCHLQQIQRINGQNWEMSSDFYSPKISPFAQATRQMADLIRYCDREFELDQAVTYRILIGLPWIKRQEWMEKFGNLPSAPPVLCEDQLGERTLLRTVRETSPRRNGSYLNERQWNILLGVIAGHVSESIDEPSISSIQEEITTRVEVIKSLNRRLFELNLDQERIGKQIPPGPQRIRGIAGSGKSVILCQRTAHLHLKYPEWDIALIFFTRSLYEQLRKGVDFWLKRFSSDEVNLDKAKDKINILHAWGAKDEIGFYTKFRDELNLSRIVSSPINGSPPERLAQLCNRVLEHQPPLSPCFDAVLIDEGQDLVVDQQYKFENHQPIYWLAWQSLRPISSEEQNLRRLYWAYDESQNLDALIAPQYKELFGDELAEQLVGRLVGPTYPGNILKNEAMKCCFRTPERILVAAHALGMGLLRTDGKLRRLNKQGWSDIGYEVEGDFRRIDSTIRIWRKPENSLNLLSQMWKDKLIEFQKFNNKNSEIEAVAQKVKETLESGFQPDRQLLIITLGNVRQQRNIGNELNNQGINFFIPGAREVNLIPETNAIGNSSQEGDRSIFWHDGAITISGINRAKGNEAIWVFIVGLENIAQSENSRLLRNQLYTAMTRTLGQLWISGLKSPEISEYSLYTELEQVLDNRGQIEFHNKWDNNAPDEDET